MQISSDLLWFLAGTEIKVVLDGSEDDTPLVPSEVVFRNGFVGFKI